MKTRKPFSTISYNTPVFLIDTLNRLISDGCIEFYAFVQHEPEEDETKKHIHLYIEPNGEVDTVSLKKLFEEPDIMCPDKPPLGIISCRSSHWADWYLYALHDVDYLAAKFETRKYHYTDVDIRVSDGDIFKELIHTSDFSVFIRFKKFREAAFNMSFRDIVANGFIPVQQINQYERVYYLLRGEHMPDRTYRGKRRGHEVQD